MFLSTITKNLNWEILAEKSYFEKFWYDRVHWKIRFLEQGGFRKYQ